MPEAEQNGPITNVEKGFEELRNAYYLGRDRASLFLTAKGIKPASILELWRLVGRPGEEYHEFDDEIKDCKDMLNHLGLPYSEEHSIDEDDGITMTCENHLFMVGSDKKSLDALLTAHNADRDDYGTFGTNLGTALGYPTTAIEASATQTAMKPEEYLQEIFEDPAWPFCIFALSKEHWREEMDVVRQQAEFIEIEDPQLYDSLTSKD